MSHLARPVDIWHFSLNWIVCNFAVSGVLGCAGARLRWSICSNLFKSGVKLRINHSWKCNTEYCNDGAGARAQVSILNSPPAQPSPAQLPPRIVSPSLHQNNKHRLKENTKFSSFRNLLTEIVFTAVSVKCCNKSISNFIRHISFDTWNRNFWAKFYCPHFEIITTDGQETGDTGTSLKGPKLTEWLDTGPGQFRATQRCKGAGPGPGLHCTDGHLFRPADKADKVTVELVTSGDSARAY